MMCGGNGVEEKGLAALIQECERLQAVTTPGPWSTDDYHIYTEHPEHQNVSHNYSVDHNHICHLDDGEYITNKNKFNDGAHIVQAVNAQPKLIAALKIAREAMRDIINGNDNFVDFKEIAYECKKKMDEVCK